MNLLLSLTIGAFIVFILYTLNIVLDVLAYKKVSNMINLRQKKVKEIN